MANCGEDDDERRWEWKWTAVRGMMMTGADNDGSDDFPSKERTSML